MSFTYKEEDPYHESRVILTSEGDEFKILLQRRFELNPKEICFEIKTNGERLAGNYAEFLLLLKALLAMQIHDINNKLSPALDIEEYFTRYLQNVYPNLKRKPDKRSIEQDKEIFREFYDSVLESEDDFAKRKNIAVTTFRSKRERYELPPKSALVRVSNKAARALEFGKKNYICKHKDCWPCRLIERSLMKK
ncbi:hypothetical protein [Nitrososphaera sp.]|uniref:hypothetical protein n=1 Tax=Nitrososphaera sp. TaxID=1971748 RepID=UPI002EDAA0C4